MITNKKRNNFVLYQVCERKCVLFFSQLTINKSINQSTTEKDTLDVWVNGQKKDTTHEFGDSEGTEIKFNLDEQQQNCGCIKTISSGDKRKGMIYVLEVNGQSVNEKDVE